MRLFSKFIYPERNKWYKDVLFILCHLNGAEQRYFKSPVYFYKKFNIKDYIGFLKEGFKKGYQELVTLKMEEEKIKLQQYLGKLIVEITKRRNPNLGIR